MTQHCNLPRTFTRNFSKNAELWLFGKTALPFNCPNFLRVAQFLDESTTSYDYATVKKYSWNEKCFV